MREVVEKYGVFTSTNKRFDNKRWS